MSEQERKGNNLLDLFNYMDQVEILQLNQLIEGNEAYLIHTETKIKEMKSKIEENKRSKDIFNQKYEKVCGALEAAIISIKISNVSSEFARELKSIQEKIKQIQGMKELKSKKIEFEQAIKHFRDVFEKMEKEYKTNTPEYMVLKRLAEEQEELGKTV